MSDRETIQLPLIPEPVALKEAYQRGEITADEAIALLFPEQLALAAGVSSVTSSSSRGGRG